MSDLDAVGVVDTADELADEIEKLSEVFTALENSRLKRRTVVLLIHDMTKVGKRDIDTILDALPDLAERYLKSEEDD